MKESIILAPPARRLGSWVYRAGATAVRSKHSLDYVTVSGKGYLLQLGGMASNNSYITNHFNSYDISANVWTSRAYSYGNIAYHCTASNNTKMWIYGGVDGVTSGGLNALRTYDYTTNTWNTLVNGPGARWTSSLCYLNNNLYMFGGLTTNSGRLKDFYRYSITNNAWTKLAEGPSERNSASLAGSNNKVYLFGGYSDTTSSYLSDLWEYDVLKNEWTLLTSLPFIISTPRIGIFENGIFIFGSIGEAENIVCRFSLLTGSITILNPGMTNRFSYGFTSTGNVFYIQGGINDTVSYNNLGIFTY